MRTSVVVPLALLLSATLSHADVYKCRDAAGKITYSNMPCHSESEPVLTTATPSVPPERPAPQEVSAPVAPPPAATAPAAPVASAPAPASNRSQVTSNPIDTTRFGNLTIGMSEATVRAKVGEPDHVVEEGAQVVGRGFGRVNLREVRRYTWVYYGDGAILDSHLRFADGVLTSKEKVAR